MSGLLSYTPNGGVETTDFLGRIKEARDGGLSERDAVATGAAGWGRNACGSRATSTTSSREREVPALVGRGLSNQEIAAELVLSPLTPKTHVSRLFLKLGARDRAQLVVVAYETGLA